MPEHTQPLKILIVGPAWIGDMIMAHVLFQLLRQQNPRCEIHVLAPAWTQPILSRMPEVSRAITLPFGHKELKLWDRYRFAKQLRSEKYDQALVLPNSFKSALIPFWANIPKRIGWLGEYRFGLLNHIHYLNEKKFPKMIDRFAALAFPKHLPVPSALPYPILNIQKEQVEATVKKYNLTTQLQKPIVVLCPGAEFGPSKCWPPSHFAVVANQKLMEGYAVWLLGSANDVSIANEIQALTDNRCNDFIGKTTLTDAVDLLSLASSVVTNDSGLMHIACALNKPVIALYGSTSPAFTPPLCAHAIILQENLGCQPCFQRTCPLQHHNCMKNLSPNKVLQHHAVAVAMIRDR